MPKYIDLRSWKRADQFHFFKDFDKPVFNITADVDVTRTLGLCRQEGHSFFLASLFNSLKVANEIEPFRYRIQGDKVAVYEAIHAGSTILNEDKTFGFCYFEYHPDPAIFLAQAAQRLEDYHRKGRCFEPADHRDDLIFYSVIPWISFTSFSHARKNNTQVSVPRIVLGKYYRVGELWKMPVSVEVHHALMDGLHVGQFFQALSDLDQATLAANL